MVLLGGIKRFSVFDRQSGSLIAGMQMGSNALCRDLRRGDLIATSKFGELFWIPRYSDALQGSVKGARLHTDGRAVSQLSFENGRVAFVVQVGLSSYLSLTPRLQANLMQKKKYIYNFRASTTIPTDTFPAMIFLPCSCSTSKTGTQKRGSRDQSCRSSALISPRK
jgi:hypothetical protein